jgi:hypothetical protein
MLQLLISGCWLLNCLRSLEHWDPRPNLTRGIHTNHLVKHNFSAVLTKVLHWSLLSSLVRLGQNLRLYPFRHILILSFHLCLGLCSNSTLPGFLIYILYAFLVSATCAAWPTNLSYLCKRFDFTAAVLDPVVSDQPLKRCFSGSFISIARLFIWTACFLQINSIYELSIENKVSFPFRL